MIGTHSRFTKQVLDYAQSCQMASGGNLNLEAREMGSRRYRLRSGSRGKGVCFGRRAARRPTSFPFASNGEFLYRPWYRLSTSDIETAPSNAPRIARLVMGSSIHRLK